MKNSPVLIVMLTYNDETVDNACEIFETCRHSKARYFGFKEESLPRDKMKVLYRRMKECGKTTVLEVVAYDEESCIDGARLAAECGCDMLMGTMYYESCAEICRDNGIKYLPFVGEITGRPSVLDGSIEDMIAEAARLREKGVDGFDLLGYRYTGDAEELIRRFVRETDLPVVVAGSVNSFERLDEIKEADPWAFTIGGAFFEQTFGDDFGEQIDIVCDHMMSHTGGRVKC